MSVTPRSLPSTSCSMGVISTKFSLRHHRHFVVRRAAELLFEMQRRIGARKSTTED